MEDRGKGVSLIEKKEIELLQDGFRFALSLTHNKSDAEDLVQECWVKLYEKQGTIENRSLLFTVIRNRFIDIYRKKKRECREFPEEIHDDHSGAQAIVDGVQIQRVEEAMGQLKPKEREIIYLQCVEQYSASEISDLTGHPRGSVLSLLSRARAKLKAILSFEREQAELLAFERSAK